MDLIPNIPLESWCPLCEIPFIRPFWVLRNFVLFGCNILPYFILLFSTAWFFATFWFTAFCSLGLAQSHQWGKLSFSIDLSFHYPYLDSQSTIGSVGFVQCIIHIGTESGQWYPSFLVGFGTRHLGSVQTS